MGTGRQIVLRFSEWLKGFGSRVSQVTRIVTRESGQQFRENVSDNQAVVHGPAIPTREQLRQQCATLPTPILEIFLPQPVSDDRLFAARENECKLLTELAQASSIKSVGPTAITGPPGSGKTSLISWLSRQFQLADNVSILRFPGRVRSENDLIHTISMQVLSGPPCSTVEDLVSGLLGRPRALILVDDAECLIFRAIGSGSVMRAFLTLMVCTQGHILWIVSLANQAWKRLDYQHGFGGYFSTVVQLGYFSQEEMRTAIDLRLGLCPASLILAGEKDRQESSIGQSTSDKDLSSDAALLDRLAPVLFENSSGNMEAALFSFLLHSRYDPLRNTLEVQPVKRIESSFPDNLATLDQLSLAEIMVHGGLTIAEHSEVFQINLADSRLALERLYRQGLLDKRSDSDAALGCAYRIHPLVLTPVSTALTNAHMLY